MFRKVFRADEVLRDEAAGGADGSVHEVDKVVRQIGGGVVAMQDVHLEGRVLGRRRQRAVARVARLRGDLDARGAVEPGRSTASVDSTEWEHAECFCILRECLRGIELRANAERSKHGERRT